MQKKLMKETRKELCDRSYRLQKTFPDETTEDMVLIFKYPDYIVPFSEQKWTEKITITEWKKRLKKAIQQKWKIK